MSTTDPQVVDSEEFIPILDYEFLGDDVTVERKRNFINHLRDCSTVYIAAHRAGISKMTAYRWKDTDPRFATAWDEAVDDSEEVMETSTYEDALGVRGEDGRYRGGNALLKMFWLKAHKPKYRDRLEVDVEVLHHEIESMVKDVNVLQLPPMSTQFVDSNGNQAQVQQYQPASFASPSQQKED